MNNVTDIAEGEEVMINTNRYKRIGDKLVNVVDSNDTIKLSGGESMMGMMIEQLNIING